MRPGHAELLLVTSVSVFRSECPSACPHLQCICRLYPVRTSDASRSSWRGGVVVSGIRRTNEVNPRRARLVVGWVTVFGRVYHLGV